MIPIGKKERPPVAAFIVRRIELRDPGCNAASCGDFVQRLCRSRRENDDPVLIPRPATAVPCIADCQDWPARSVGALDLPLREKADLATIVRPERILPLICSRK